MEKLTDINGFSGVISIDRQGRWWYEGNQIIHPEVLALFRRSLVHESDGGYFIDYRGKRAPVEVAVCPFFITDVEASLDDAGGLRQVVLVLDDGSRETLAPAKLSLDGEGVLRTRVKDDRFCARFLPGAHFRLAEFLRPGAGEDSYELVIGGRKYRLTTAAD
ncbi:MAG: DUF1285 domain-containing protein [Deltaproteobacteria bacterium]|nr:DUF1285 domain-containing protein [Deltaproteobacteria bacterium]